MLSEELIELADKICKQKAKEQTIEVKSALMGCPKRLYDTLSSFSNQDSGGIIVFGIDEDALFNVVGVYNPQDLQKRIAEQCQQMEPPVRAVFTMAEYQGKTICAVEVPPVDYAERPCFYRGHGRLKGSFVRVGDSDEPMTEYEIYSYDAFRKKYQDDIRSVERASLTALDQSALHLYLDKLKQGKPKLSNLNDREICELMSISRDGKVTLNAALLFSPYPQAYFPQLCITAVCVPGKEIGEYGAEGERFIDNKRIEGTIPDMLQEALQFVRKNMRTKTIIDPVTGLREDKTDYPITAVREAIINALVHRDYSMHTEGMPIQLLLFEDRMEIRNPGGIYGRIQINQLGKVQPDTRNPVLASALEVMGITENRYSGIPTIRKAMREYGLPEPAFSEERGSFVVRFRKEQERAVQKNAQAFPTTYRDGGLLAFCEIPRSRDEICAFLNLKSKTYVIREYVAPLLEEGALEMMIPDKPRSEKQRYVTSGANRMR